MNEPAIRHDTAGHRFSTIVDGHDCVIDYRLAGSVMTITHTGVPEQVGGRGIAAQLMAAALDAARAAGWTVVPACSYALHFMAKHPEYADLRAHR
jgi:predicted GNAT family acetyltransferase